MHGRALCSIVAGPHHQPWNDGMLVGSPCASVLSQAKGMRDLGFTSPFGVYGIYVQRSNVMMMGQAID